MSYYLGYNCQKWPFLKTWKDQLRTESDLIAKIIQLSKSRSRESLSLSRSIMGESKDLQSLATEIIEKLNAWNKTRPPTLYLHNLHLSSKPDLIILLKIDFYFCNHFVLVIYGFQIDTTSLPSHWSISLALIGRPIGIKLIPFNLSLQPLYF